MTKENYFEGISKTLKNAQELFDEAEILESHNKLCRLYTLYQFCIEESGKAVLIYSYLMTDDLNDQIEFNKFRKEFLNHTSKTNASLTFDMILVFVMKECDELKKTLVLNNFIQKENLKTINHFKNLSLYTSIIDEKFKTPSEIIDQDLIERIKFNALLRLNVAQQFYEVTIENFDHILSNSKQIDQTEYINKMVSKLKDIINK